MNYTTARLLVGASVHELRNMALALALHSWTNSTTEWKRLEAACAVLGRKAPRQARAVLEARRARLEGARP